MTENGKHSFPLVLGNLIKQLKREISQLPDSVSEQEVQFLLMQYRITESQIRQFFFEYLCHI